MYAGEVDKSFDMVLQGTTAPNTSYRHYTSSFHEVFHVRRQPICRLKYRQWILNRKSRAHYFGT